jgi:hypothetical protein
MKRFLILVALALLAVGAYAADLDTRGLTAEQVRAIQAQIAQQTVQNAKGGDVNATLSLASTWGSQAAVAAEGFAKALGIAARELGVTVNDFLGTPAGKLTAAVIIWKVAGATIVSMLYGSLVLVLGCTIAWQLARSIGTEKWELVPYSRLWGLWSGQRRKRVLRPYKDYSEGEAFMTFVCVGLAAASMLAAGLLIRL